MIKEMILSVLKDEPLDISVINGEIINVYTSEIVSGEMICIKGSKIVYSGEFKGDLAEKSLKIIDAKGKYVSPGLIETHTHIAQIVPLEEFTEKSLLSGTTTVVTETAEFANSSGIEGVKAFIDNAKQQHLRLYVTLPPLTPPFPEFETSVGLTLDEYKELLQDDIVLGLGEFYWSRILNFSDFYEELIEYTHSVGKTVHGHSSGAKGKKLNAYVSMGIKSCHEPITEKEVLERVRLGLHVVLREGAVRCDFSNVYGFKEKLKDLRMVSVSTDGITPLWLAEKGTLSEIARRAVRLGFSPVETVKMLSLNASYVFNLQDIIGALTPGKFADIAIFEDLENFRVNTVIVDGEVKVENKISTIKKKRSSYPEILRKSVKVKNVTEKDFVYFSTKKREKVIAVKYLEFLLTGSEEVELPVENNNIIADIEKNVLKYIIFDRYGSFGRVKGFIKDLGFSDYTFASTLNWEANQLIAIGADESDLAIAVNRIIELNGGIVLVKEGKIEEEIPLPVSGIMSETSLDVLSKKESNINLMLKNNGCRMENPFLWMQTLSFTGLPYYKLTDKGLVDVRRNEIFAIKEGDYTLQAFSLEYSC